MKPANYKFQWFEQEDRRKLLRASVSKEGKLRLGRRLREKLPKFIQVGFDASAMVLAIADGHGAGINCPACGVMSAQALSKQITAVGLRLPIVFHLEQDQQPGYLWGGIMPRRWRDGMGDRQFDIEQLLILFRPILDGIVHQLGKSTPLEDRKSIVAEAMCVAAQEYRPGYGDLGTYLEDRIKLTLCTENRQHVEAFGQRSLDQPISCDDKGGFCLYDTIADSDADWVDALDGRIDLERFCSSLSPNQQELIRMLQEGFLIAEIADLLGMDERDVRRMSAEIARQRRKLDKEMGGPVFDVQT